MDASRSDKERGAAKVTVEEAARTLGITDSSVRKRVSRGKMYFEKAEDDRLYVCVDDTELTGNAYVGKSEDLYAARSVDETRHIVHELIASKVKTIRILQDQLQVEQEARRAEMPEHHNRTAVERMRAHLAGPRANPKPPSDSWNPKPGRSWT